MMSATEDEYDEVRFVVKATGYDEAVLALFIKGLIEEHAKVQVLRWHADEVDLEAIDE